MTLLNTANEFQASSEHRNAIRVLTLLGLHCKSTPLSTPGQFCHSVSSIADDRLLIASRDPGIFITMAITRTVHKLNMGESLE